MSSKLAKKTRKTNFLGICSATHIEIEAHSIRTKGGQIWINLNNGLFMLRSSLTGDKPKTDSILSLYFKITTVVKDGCIIARLDSETDSLRYLKYKQPLTSFKKRFK